MILATHQTPGQQMFTAAVEKDMHTRTRTRTLLTAIAALVATAACGGEIEVPAPGEPDSPQPAPPEAASVTVPTATAAPGSSVTVRARGFTPNARVEIGFGQPRSEYTVVREATTDAQGGFETTVQVPDWANRGEPYVVVVTEPDHDPREVSDPFVVGSGGDRIEVHGELTDEGVECPALRGPFGTLYTLAVSDLEHGPGTEVMVRGTIAEMSTCMQGTTIAVESVEAHH